MSEKNTFIGIISTIGLILAFLIGGIILLFMISPPENFFSIAVIGICWAWFDWRLRYKLLLTPIAILVLPAIISCIWAIIDYSGGAPSLRTFGLMRGVVYDYETRLPFSSSGCTVIGLEFITFDPYNKTIRLLTRGFGYAKSAYQNPLPDLSEAKSLISTKGKRIQNSLPTVRIPSINGPISVNLDSIRQIDLIVLLTQQELSFYDYSKDVVVIGGKEHIYVIIRSMKNQFISVT